MANRDGVWEEHARMLSELGYVPDTGPEATSDEKPATA
jgi:hypothetical protein